MSPASIFLLATAAILGLALAWGCRHLPRERWQMLAVIPVATRGFGLWHGINLTYYGLFLATAQVLAIVLLLMLTGAAGLPIAGTLLVVFLLLAACLPAAKIIARVVEKRRHTFTIGGAACLGILLAPGCTLLVDRLLTDGTNTPLPLPPVLAAMAVGYTLGEGLGRLGCLSFGCCYGKALRDCPPVLREIVAPIAVIFQGRTKKAVYEGRLENEPLVPIQALTANLLCATALAGTALFLQGRYIAALVLSLGISQAWRIFSETLRADFRGFAKISAYQKMSALAIVYILAVATAVGTPDLPPPDIGRGVRLIWHPGVIILLQLYWLLAFAVFGRSTVTTATLSFRLVRENPTLLHHENTHQEDRHAPLHARHLSSHGR